MTLFLRASILLAQRTRDCKRKRETEQPYAPAPNRNGSFVSPLGVCRALAHEHGHSTGAIAGRVEHVVSGQSMHFASLEELLAFIDQVLANVRAPPRRRPRAK